MCENPNASKLKQNCQEPYHVGDFPAGPVVTMLCSQPTRPGLIPGQGTRAHVLRRTRSTAR